MPPPSWNAFRTRHDLLAASHRGLQRELIPRWLSSPKTLSEKIESSAYGETPAPLIHLILDLLAPQRGERFLDLGCGGGNVLAEASSRGLRILGLERNPQLLAAARQYFDGHPDVQLEEGDFLQHSWDDVRLAYSTTARFPAALLQALARKVQDSPPLLRAVACLGRPLPLTSEVWSEEAHGQHPVVWNAGEQPMNEPLFVYRRLSPT